MNENSFRKDLFEDQVYESKVRKLGLLSKYSKQRILSYISVPVEYMVIVSIAVLVLMIVSYAIGVERGKNVSGKIGTKTEVSENTLETKARQDFSNKIKADLDSKIQKEDKQQLEEKSVMEIDVREEEIQNVTMLEEEDVLPDISRYTVQLASFKNKDAAINETYKLKDKGISAEYIKKGNWYQVYAEGFSTIEEARGAQQMLVQYYEDCFIRKMVD